MGEFGQGALEYMKRKKAGTYALVQHVSRQAEGDMKMGAPWKDRTTNTRRSLHSGVEKSNDKIIMYMAHGSKVGNYLEEGTGIHGPIGAPYDIVPVNGQALYWRGAKHPVHAIRNHPGMKARPIVQPTAIKYKGELRDALLKWWGAE